MCADVLGQDVQAGVNERAMNALCDQNTEDTNHYTTADTKKEDHRLGHDRIKPFTLKRHVLRGRFVGFIPQFERTARTPMTEPRNLGLKPKARARGERHQPFYGILTPDD